MLTSFLYIPTSEDKRLKKVMSLIHDSPGINYTISEFAHLVNSSEKTLARLFIKETGMTFGKWREHVRLIYAIDQLTQGQSITKTAIELGYTDTSSFTTLFTRALGLPPKKFMMKLNKQ